MQKKTEDRRPKTEVRKPRRAARPFTDTELLQIAIMRTEANITVCERSLADFRAKHHNQCAELARQLRNA